MVLELFVTHFYEEFKDDVVFSLAEKLVRVGLVFNFLECHERLDLGRTAYGLDIRIFIG
jgi:hypothetical protein